MTLVHKTISIVQSTHMNIPVQLITSFRECVHMWYKNGCIRSYLETKHHAEELFVMNCYNSILISVILPECRGECLQQKVKLTIIPFMNENMHLYIICISKILSVDAEKPLLIVWSLKSAQQASIFGIKITIFFFWLCIF